MQIKSITALAFATALSVLGTAPASATTNVANVATEALAEGSAARTETSNYRCGCYRRYVRYYRVYPVVRYYRVYRVRYYYI